MAKLEKLVEDARAHLEPGEVVRAAIQGAYVTRIMGSETVRTGALIATDRRLVFYAKRLGGYDLESFPYGNISSFEQGKNVMGHHVTFFAVGNLVHMKWIKTDRDLATLTEIVKAAMYAAARPAAAPAPPPWPAAPQAVPQAPPQAAPQPAPQPDVLDLLRKLGELRDAGVLTPEEFAAKKAELLARL